MFSASHVVLQLCVILGILNLCCALICNKEVECTASDATSKYRSVTGKCNNLLNVTWGMPGEPLPRFFSPNYDDGSGKPLAKKKNGQPLPNPRVISEKLFSACVRDSIMANSFSTWYGQFLVHDMGSVPGGKFMRGNETVTAKCCDEDFAQEFPNCIPLNINKDDEYYKKHNFFCFNMKRSADATEFNGCSKGGMRQQTSSVTSFIDASTIYGSKSDAMKILINKSDKAKFRMSDFNNLPHIGSIMGFDCVHQFGMECFKSGDSRVNVHNGLSLTHAIFTREHNRIVAKFMELKISFCDPDDHECDEKEACFEEVRKIVGAVMQVIAYKEWLPDVIGSEMMQKYSLKVGEPEDGYTVYESATNPTLVNEFTTAAMRFGHSMVPDHLMVVKPTAAGHTGCPFEYKDTFRNTLLIHAGLGPSLVVGSVSSPARGADVCPSVQMRNHLFQFPKPAGKFGLDIIAVNINRGRDHGLASYATVFEAIHKTPLTWDTVRKEAENVPVGDDPSDKRDVVGILQQLYGDGDGDVKDIDLFVGGLIEKTIHDGSVGKTFAEIIAAGFRNTKFGDRYYFEHGDEGVRFTKQQLAELRKQTSAAFICRNIHEVVKMPRNAMRQPSADNKWMDCTDRDIFPDIDFTLWGRGAGTAVPEPDSKENQI